jgi:hypothetical protein
VITGLTLEPTFGLVVFIGVGLNCWTISPIKTGAISGSLLLGIIGLIFWSRYWSPKLLLGNLIVGLVAGLILSLIGKLAYTSLRLDDIPLKHTRSFAAIMSWQWESVGDDWSTAFAWDSYFN